MKKPSVVVAALHSSFVQLTSELSTEKIIKPLMVGLVHVPVILLAEAVHSNGWQTDDEVQSVLIVLILPSIIVLPEVI